MTTRTRKLLHELALCAETPEREINITYADGDRPLFGSFGPASLRSLAGAQLDPECAASLHSLIGHDWLDRADTPIGFLDGTVMKMIDVLNTLGFVVGGEKVVIPFYRIQSFGWLQ